MKQTDQHLIVVTYETRRRLLIEPEQKPDFEMAKKLQEKSFGQFLRETGMAPPEMMGKEFEE